MSGHRWAYVLRLAAADAWRSLGCAVSTSAVVRRSCGSRRQRFCASRRTFGFWRSSSSSTSPARSRRSPDTRRRTANHAAPQYLDPRRGMALASPGSRGCPRPSSCRARRRALISRLSPRRSSPRGVARLRASRTFRGLGRALDSAPEGRSALSLPSAWLVFASWHDGRRKRCRRQPSAACIQAG